MLRWSRLLHIGLEVEFRDRQKFLWRGTVGGFAVGRKVAEGLLSTVACSIWSFIGQNLDFEDYSTIYSHMFCLHAKCNVPQARSLFVNLPLPEFSALRLQQHS